MNNKNHPYSMSDIIATMAINGATKDELDRVIKYSAAVIDAERARKALGIDELEKKYMSRYLLPTTIEVVNEKEDHDEVNTTEDSHIKPEPKTYEEELNAVDAFFDKYETLISTAYRNSLLGMLNELNEAIVNIEGCRVVEELVNSPRPASSDLKEAEAHITHVALILAQMWLDENQDIKLTCVDPANGEETVINGEEEKDNV